MREMSDERIRDEMIRVFELIKELDGNPDMLRKLPKHSKLVYKGKKRMFISTDKDAKVVLL
ncbi:MAG: hypothetical protein FJY76_03165 [Candidatus Aenigmarchaeota archaeon]|nr:hypothetical protein [Candidatus Aenigmarchaeota archaeon]